MKDRQVRGTIITVIIVWFVGSICVSGCAMGHKSIKVSPQKILVMELSKNPEYQELLGGKPQTCGMRSGRVYLLPGQTCGQHSTKDHEELLIFLSGKGAILIGEEETPYEVSKGKVCYIPPYTIHNNKNTGTEPLIYIYCVTPVSSLD